MKYTTRNEFSHFIYDDAQIAEVEITAGMFHLYMDNVSILPECSANRDIRKMRCNNMLFRVEEMKLESFVQEGYRIYNADGKLMREDPDTELAPEDYAEKLKCLSEGYVVSFEKKEAENGRCVYILAADGNDEHTYDLTVSGSADVQEWDRFLSPAGSF